MQNNNNYSNDIKNLGDFYQITDVIIYDYSEDELEEKIINSNEEIAKLAKKLKEKFKKTVENFSDNLILFLPKKKLTETNLNANNKNEMERITPEEYFNLILRRVEKYTNTLNNTINKFSDYINFKKNEPNGFYRELLEEILRIKDLHYDIFKDLEDIIDFYIGFFEELKGLDLEEKTQIDLTKFENDFSKKLRLLYKSREVFENKLESLKNVKKHIKKPFTIDEKEQYRNLLDDLFKKKRDLIKIYNSVGERVEETDEFNKENYEDLINTASAILEKKDYYINLTKGEWLSKPVNELEEMKKKSKLCLDEMQRFIDYLNSNKNSLNGLELSEKNNKTINLKEDENLTTEQKKLLEEKFLSDNLDSYSDDYNKKSFLNKKRKNSRFEESRDYDYLNFIQNAINKAKNSNINFGAGINNLAVINQIQDCINKIKNIYNFLEKVENANSFNEIKNLIENNEDKDFQTYAANYKKQMEDKYNFLMKNINRSNIEENKALIINYMKECLKKIVEDLIMVYKRVIVTKFRVISENLNFDENHHNDYIFKIINIVNANRFMEEQNLFENTPSGLFKKMFNLEEFLNASGIREQDFQKFKESDFYDAECIENVKELVEMAEAKQLTTKNMKRLVLINDFLKDAVEDYVYKKSINDLASAEKKCQDVFKIVKTIVKLIKEETNEPNQQ